MPSAFVTRHAVGLASFGAAACLMITGQMLIATEYCPESIGPDLIVSDLPFIQRWGTIGGVTAYSIATTSCNFGDAEVQWEDTTANHPVIAQHLYRLTDRRIEQIGISFVKHGFGALQDDECCPDCQPAASNDTLGVGCSDPYSASMNGNQTGFLGQAGLGPRSDINASHGTFPFPYTFQGQGGDAIYKRLQVDNRDLDPEFNDGARYFAEGQYIALDDSLAGNHFNNVSSREVIVVGPVDGGWHLAMAGPVFVMQPALHAWRDADHAVQIEIVDVPEDGRFHVAYRVTPNDDGTWHYEYAVHNQNSHRSAEQFTLPIADAIELSAVEFHDIAYHSGDPYADDDWIFTRNDGMATWRTLPGDVFPNANALRWGTLYNFAFDTPAPPVRATATLTLFRPGTPDAVTVPLLAPGTAPCPGDLDHSGAVDFNDLLAVLDQWGACVGCAADLDASGTVDFGDLTILLSAWGACR